MRVVNLNSRYKYIRVPGTPLEDFTVSEFREAYPEEVFIIEHLISCGGGITIVRGEEQYWISAALVRGHRPPTEKELAEVPKWASTAYHEMYE